MSFGRYLLGNKKHVTPVYTFISDLVIDTGSQLSNGSFGSGGLDAAALRRAEASLGVGKVMVNPFRPRPQATITSESGIKKSDLIPSLSVPRRKISPPQTTATSTSRVGSVARGGTTIYDQGPILSRYYYLHTTGCNFLQLHFLRMTQNAMGDKFRIIKLKTA